MADNSAPEESSSVAVVDESTAPGDDAPADQTATSTRRGTVRSLTFTLRGVVLTISVLAIFVAAVVFALLWRGAEADLSTADQQAQSNARAEKVAGDYALGAATVNYQNVGEWTTKLKAGTTPELAAKFDATAPKLQEILTPLQWTSTATPITAKVMSSANGIYKVNVFLNVTSTNAQNPNGSQSTVTYSVTMDSNSDWKIIDVGGMDGALPVK